MTPKAAFHVGLGLHDLVLPQVTKGIHPETLCRKKTVKLPQVAAHRGESTSVRVGTQGRPAHG